MVGGMCSMLPYDSGICYYAFKKKKVIASVHSFLYFFKNLVLINRWNGPRYQRVLTLCAFLTGVITKELILRKFCV